LPTSPEAVDHDEHHRRRKTQSHL